MKNKKKFKKRYIIYVIVVIAIGISLKHKFSKPAVNMTYTEITAKPSSLNFSYDANGVVKAKKVVSIFSNTSAEVNSVKYREGDAVKKGDVLVTLKRDDGDVQRLNIQKAQMSLDEATKQELISKKLYLAGGLSKAQYDKAVEDVKLAKINLEIANSGNKKFENTITSPISGVILECNVDVNYQVSPSKPLFTIADTENLQINLEISNAKARDVKEGQEVDVTSDSLPAGEVLKGKVKSVSKISFKSSTSNELITRVIVELDNYDTLKPGDNVTAKIKYSNVSDSIILPFQYINFEDSDAYVYVVKNGIVNKVKVELGKNDGINYVIKSGINKGDKLIDNLNGSYKQGDKLK